MGPCAVCGSLTINATGHCAHCGTYRGLPGQVPPPGRPGYPPVPGNAGPGYPPTSGAPAGYPGVSPNPGYPTSGGGVGFPGAGPSLPNSAPPGGPSYPSSGPPGSAGYPSSGPPGTGYPSSGAGYPGGYPPPVAPNRNRSFLVPLIALASTLVVLVVAIVIVVFNRDDDPTDPVTYPSSTSRIDPTSDPTRSDDDPSSDDPRIDSCVIGTWRVTSHREDVSNDELGKLSFTGGDGAELRLKADGTGESDYGSGTAYTAKASNGKSIKLEVTGVVSYSYTAVDGRISVDDVKSQATFRFYIDGEQYGDTQAFNASDSPSNYTCSGDRMTQKTLLYTIDYERAS